MGKRGPVGKPSAIKALEGNPGKRPLNKNEPVPDNLKNLKPPPFLPAAAKREWKRIIMQLSGLGLISDLDVMGLAAYCNAYATWLEAIKKIKETGMLVRSPNGYAMPSPYLKIQRDAQSEMMSWLKEFGMTPAARARVSGDGSGEEEDDPFMALAKRARESRGGAA